MNNIGLKPSLRTIRYIAEIERLAGRWEHLASSKNDTSNKNIRNAITLGCNAGLFLDTSTVTSQVTSQRKSDENEALKNFIRAHQKPFTLNIQNLLQLNALISQNEQFEKSSLFRQKPENFSVPGDERLFDSLAAFLIENKLEELVKKTQAELNSGPVHPLYTIGIFYISFLQIQPFATANHRTVIALTWHLLINNGFEFLAFSHFAVSLKDKRNQYFNALRQAERTVNGNWSTINIWLEFFLEILILSKDKMANTREQIVAEYRMTDVQKKMFQVIQNEGSLCRSKIVSLTGINVSTIKYNLGVLTKKGLLKQTGGGRSTSYTVC